MRGAVFTRREVVDFMLDIAGYSEEKPLWRYRFLEPSFGNGEFLVAAIERLMKSYAGNNPATDLTDAIRGFEIDSGSFEITQRRIVSLLIASGIPAQASAQLVKHWLVADDFLLADVVIPMGFTHVLGNPPYVRQEMIDPQRLTTYRARYTTIFDRADLYVPFFERSLELLSTDGTCCMICSDRWMKNRYGAPLRTYISSRFHLASYVDMVGVPAFAREVIAYPAITTITRARSPETRLAFRPPLDRETLRMIASALRGETSHPSVTRAFAIDAGPHPWLLHAPTKTQLVRRLETEFPLLEEAGCRIGIGVATGADKAFIAPFEEMDVEPGRKIPLVTTRDIRDGYVRWHGLGVINPFEDDGKLASLSEYPKMAAWLEAHDEAIRKRHIARKRPEAWYRTIDRILPSLAKQKKLLIPDIKGSAHIVLEEGNFYPHHNLYFIVSESWNLRALKAVLECGIADLFVSTYSVKMAGGHLRFQAQYLRRIRIPAWEDIDEQLRTSLMAAIESANQERTRELVFDIFRLTPAERNLLETGEPHAA